MTIADYVRAYRDNARQLGAPPIAGRWRAAGVDPLTAAAWANRGYLPEEAADHIAAGVTPELVEAVERALCDDSERLAALTLDLMFGGGR